tara:strand:+ start:840 stop:1100 length:261 start_codon:yes stop_codon:yes gene_type:complete
LRDVEENPTCPAKIVKSVILDADVIVEEDVNVDVDPRVALVRFPIQKSVDILSAVGERVVIYQTKYATLNDVLSPTTKEILIHVER